MTLEIQIPIKFTVHGLPQTAGSKRAFVVNKGKPNARAVVSDANPKSRDWKNSVASAAQPHALDTPLTGPLWVRFVFFLPRPKGHFGAGSKASIVRASAPRYPSGRPDVLKLARAVEDALSGVIWGDDAQIVDERLYKRYGWPRAWRSRYGR